MASPICLKKINFYVANAATDEISIYDDNNFKFIDKIIFSNKSKEIVDGQCHINDLYVIRMQTFLLLIFLDLDYGERVFMMEGFQK